MSQPGKAISFGLKTDTGKKSSLDIIRGHLKALMWNHSAVMFKEFQKGGVGLNCTSGCRETYQSVVFPASEQQ